MCPADSPPATSYAAPEGDPALVRLVVDPETFNYYIEAPPRHSAAAVTHVLAVARGRGLKPIDFDRDDDKTNDRAVKDGRPIRIWLEPTDRALASWNIL